MLNQPFLSIELASKSFYLNTTAITLKDHELDGIILGAENGMIHEIKGLEKYIYFI